MHQDLKWIEEIFSDIFGVSIVLEDTRVDWSRPTKPKPVEDKPKKKEWHDYLFEFETEEEYREPRQVNWETLITPKRVIFNAPATIVWWSDGTKTVVKCHQDDTYDKEKGLAMAFMKRMYGNDGYFNEIVKEWCPYEC